MVLLQLSGQLDLVSRNTGWGKSHPVFGRSERTEIKRSFHQKKKNYEATCSSCKPGYFASSASLELNACLTLPNEDRILFQSMKYLSLNNFSVTPGVSASEGTKNLLLECNAFVTPQSTCPTPPRAAALFVKHSQGGWESWGFQPGGEEAWGTPHCVLPVPKADFIKQRESNILHRQGKEEWL